MTRLMTVFRFPLAALVTTLGTAWCGLVAGLLSDGLLEVVLNGAALGFLAMVLMGRAIAPARRLRDWRAGRAEPLSREQVDLVALVCGGLAFGFAAGVLRLLPLSLGAF